MGVSIEPEFSVAPVVSPAAAGGLVPLYDADKRVAYVPGPEVDHWLANGYTRTEAAPGDAVERTRAAWVEFGGLVRMLAQAPAYERSENGVAHQLRDSWVALEGAYREMVAVFEATYPPAA